jgi:predicted ATPase/transcriptional regulator with GAF, ATPase, and Fis domain
MLAVPGYTSTQELHRGRKCVVVRARRDRDDLPVILKTPAADFPKPSDVAAIRREYDILASLAVPGVARAAALEVVRDRPVLVLEDHGGVSLKGLLAGKPLDLAAFFGYATALAGTVAELHRRGVLHKDLNPKNILVHAETRAVTLLDFGISSRSTSEEQPLQHPHLLEGTIAYMSPEQTGRMNRDIDHRSDLYSLGVTLYEMLTGRLPFDSPDPLEVIHAQIAIDPVAPVKRVPGVPAALSAVVMKLLAKSPEDRYQSASGLKADLERAEEAWRNGANGGVTAGPTAGAAATAAAATTFPLGQDDVPDRFTVPQRLYGRDNEVTALLESFSRVSAGGVELALVSGYSGIGKTSLIRELYKSLPRHRGQVIAGKFDQLARDVPYDALAQAFRALVRQVLTGDEASVRDWAARLQAALGPNGKLVLDILPELELIVGPQPPVPPLDPAEAQNRFNLTFHHFVGVFARPEHPLVLFIDDMQWADAATLSLLPLLLTGDSARGLLVIGAYRDNEVGPSHPLRELVEGLKETSLAITHVSLTALRGEHLRQFIGDALRTGPEKAAPVSDLVLGKTGGNPFFLTQFLRTLHQDGYVTFDRAAHEWRVDLEAIHQANLTDNVVEFVGDRIQRLEPEAQRALRLAACLGNRFDLKTLATIGERPAAEIAAAVWEAATMGLVVPTDRSYGFAPDLAAGVDPSRVVFRFLHDRVQQAAYAQIPEAERPAVHLGVGRTILAEAGVEEPALLFEVVNHLNVGRGLIREAAERTRLAELNLAAGRKARASGAYSSAGTYFAAGMSLLVDEAWRDQHAMAFALHLERYEADYLCGRFEEAEAGFRRMLERSDSPLERADVTVRLNALFETMSRYGDCIRAGLEALRALGVNLPEEGPALQLALAEEFRWIEARVGERPIESLIDLPALEEPSVHRAMTLLMSVWAPAYISGQNVLSHLVSARMVRLSLEHGNCGESAFGYLHHAVAIGYSYGQNERAFEFGTLALAINARLADLRLRAAVHHRFAALVNLWSRPFATSVAHAKEAVRMGLESGQLQVAAYAEFQQTWYGTQLDRNLDAFLEKHEHTVEMLAKLKSPAFLAAQRLIMQWAHALRGETRAKTSLTTDTFDEGAFVRTVGRVGIFRGLYAALRLELLDTFEETEEARRFATEREVDAEFFASSLWPALFAFRHALAIAAWLPAGVAKEAADATQVAANAKLDALELRLRRWAASAPENFAHFHELVAAEIARVRNRPGEAMERYEAAIESAERQPSPRHRALANELYGRFWLQRGQPKIAAVFLREARFGYAQWGATAKVADLDRRHAELLAKHAAPAAAGGEASVLTTTATAGVALDALALARAAQAISREIELEPVLERLMRSVLESSGAERGSLYLEGEGGPRVFVDGTPDEVQVRAADGTPLEETELVPGLVHLVMRTGDAVVLDDASEDEHIRNDPYVFRHRPRSMLCAPVMNQGKVVGVLYLENRLAAGAFGPERLQVTEILSSQAAIAIENARLFAEVSRLRDRLQAENVYLQAEIKTSHGFTDIVGDTPALRKVLAQAEQVAPTATTVLITGETGTGKELVARAIHRMSPRAERPLIAVNCGAISPGLVESELFGHEKGAFTGALTKKIGRFELADGGTIFLDEIGDLPLDLQTKLLRVLQEGEIDRVGGTKPIRVDVRVVAATHRDLARAVEARTFREDLFYRLNVFPIRLPALRERPEDIPLLVRHFVLLYGTKMGKRVSRIPRDTMNALTSYRWPGNVRELANVIERSVIVSRGDSLDLADWTVAPAPGTPTDSDSAIGELEDVERQHIMKALIQMGWRVSGPQGAAKVLGLRPTTLEARMKKLGISRPQ